MICGARFIFVILIVVVCDVDDADLARVLKSVDKLFSYERERGKGVIGTSKGEGVVLDNVLHDSVVPLGVAKEASQGTEYAGVGTQGERRA